MIAQNGSFFTVNCTASEFYDVKIKWFLGGKEITSKSKGITTFQEQASSELQVNFTSFSDVTSNYMCEKFGDFQLNCTTHLSCVTERDNANGDRRDHSFVVVLGKQFQRSNCLSYR